MGYKITLKNQDFFISSSNQQDALQAIRSLMYDPTANTLDSDSCAHNVFSWMHHTDPESWQRIDDALEAWRFKPTVNPAGHITELTFTGEKVGDEEQLFGRIAKYVEDGSWLHFVGEDGQEWMFVFIKDNAWKARPFEV